MNKVDVKKMIHSKAQKIRENPQDLSEKTCFFCQLNTPMRGGQIEIRLRGKMLQVISGGELKHEFGISYCPLCGEIILPILEKENYVADPTHQASKEL
ncbi:MAG: hypothetical protein IJ716_11605 [Lachnospiraceae bacterium]|nr:hypothetical protein [Lachnospiraceae bacterium]